MEASTCVERIHAIFDGVNYELLDDEHIVIEYQGLAALVARIDDVNGWIDGVEAGVIDGTDESFRSSVPAITDEAATAEQAVAALVDAGIESDVLSAWFLFSPEEAIAAYEAATALL